MSPSGVVGFSTVKLGKQGRDSVRRFFIAILVLVAAGNAVAQVVIPIRYRVTRTASGQQTITHTFNKSNMTCDIAPVPLAQMAPGTLRIGDPERDTRDCELNATLTAPVLANMVREVTYTYTIAGQANDIDPYGPESAPFTVTLPRIPQIPPAPASPRLAPPPPPQQAMGTVNQRFEFFDGSRHVDVASGVLDFANIEFLFAIPGRLGALPVQEGQRFAIAVW